MSKPHSTGTGEGLKPGDDHYRAYVGPPQDYDLVSAMTFNLLTSAGLRHQHRLLDIGCGSLRSGRLFIPYLDAGNYVGVEPNAWLVQDGILNETGEDLIRLKRPLFSHATTLAEFREPLQLDYAVAQSIFSHTSLRLLDGWLKDCALHLKDSGALFATFLEGKEDYQGDGWVYPGCVNFRLATLEQAAARQGFRFMLLDWYHPRQRWALFARPGYDLRLVADGKPSWNAAAARR
jgi:cyclopropane fatty-acyl-phospholipid synthase-like methyltransferase